MNPRRRYPGAACALLVALALWPALSPVAGQQDRAPGVGAQTYTNPVYDHDFPDPFILHDGNTWYAYGTDGDLGDVQVIKSPDLVSWTSVGSAIAKTDEPSWAQHDDVWVPAPLVQVLHARSRGC